MLYSGSVGFIPPSRLMPEPSLAGGVPGGSLGQVIPLVTERGDNPRLAGLGCGCSREVSRVGAGTIAGMNHAARLGLIGLAEDFGVDETVVPVEFRDAARTMLASYARLLQQGVEALERDVGGPASPYYFTDAYNELRGLWDMQDLGEPSLREIWASKREALAQLDTVYAASASEAGLRDFPAFAAAAKTVATRIAARARSSDFDKSAVLSPAEVQKEAAALALWGEKLKRDEAAGLADRCSPLRVWTGEMTAAQFATQCTPVPQVGKGLLVALAIAVAIFGFGVGRGLR